MLGGTRQADPLEARAEAYARRVVGLKPMDGGDQVEVPVDEVVRQVRKMLDDAD